MADANKTDLSAMEAWYSQVSHSPSSGFRVELRVEGEPLRDSLGWLQVQVLFDKARLSAWRLRSSG